MAGGAWVWFAAVAAGLTAWWWVPPCGMARLGAGRLEERLGAWGSAVAGRARSLWRARGEAERHEALRASVPAVCELLAVCLDAGRPPRTALRVLVGVLDGPAAEELSGVLAQIDLGVDEAEAWGTLTGVAGYREVGRDLARSVRSGLGLAALLRQHAVDARSAQASRSLVRARAAGVQGVVPLMVCFLPAFVLLGVVPLFGSLVQRLLP